MECRFRRKNPNRNQPKNPNSELSKNKIRLVNHSKGFDKINLNLKMNLRAQIVVSFEITHDQFKNPSLIDSLIQVTKPYLKPSRTGTIRH